MGFAHHQQLFGVGMGATRFGERVFERLQKGDPLNSFIVIFKTHPMKM